MTKWLEIERKMGWIYPLEPLPRAPLYPEIHTDRRLLRAGSDTETDISNRDRDLPFLLGEGEWCGKEGGGKKMGGRWLREIGFTIPVIVVDGILIVWGG